MEKMARNQWFILQMLILAYVWLGGCATLAPSGNKPDAALLEVALEGVPLLGQPYDETELPERDLFELTPAMREFAERHTADVRSEFSRAKALHNALLTPSSAGGRGITYTAFYTLTGAEAFEQRQANCLSFTLLYVTMARHVGLKAYVNEVDLPPTWDIRNQDAFLFLRHVNSKVKMRRDQVVIDLEMDRYHTSYDQRLISEKLAAAQFYNNRGMELAAEGDVKQGFLHLRKALLLDDKQAYIWNNFATLYRRQGLMKEAEALYLRGLEEDRGDLTIISNLSGLYQELGDQEKAEVYFKLAEQHRNSNPYFLYYEAIRFFNAGDVQQARDLLHQAIRRQKAEPRFYDLGVKIYEALGDQTQADIMRERAEHHRQANFTL